MQDELESEKEEFARVSKKSIEHGSTKFIYAVKVSDKGMDIITSSDVEDKVNYILKAYNENLELIKAFTIGEKVKIVNYMFI